MIQFGGITPSLAEFGFIVIDRIDRCTLGSTGIVQSDLLLLSFFCAKKC